MPVDVTFEPRGRTFIPQVLRHPKFRSEGFLTGVSSKGYYYVVVNPRKHPFYVWKKSLLGNGFSPSAYESTALGLGAAAFSNGPMMAFPSAADILKKLLIQVGFFTLVGLIGVAVITAVLSGGAALPILAAAIVGAAGGAAAGVLAFFIDLLQRGCVPFNVVTGTKNGIRDPGAGENGNLVWFGRGASTDFPSFQVAGPGTGPPSAPGTPATPPASLVEVSAGLIPLVVSFVPRSNVPSSPSFNQGSANLEKKVGSVAWALIPLGAPPITGLTVGEGPLTEGELQGVDLLMPEDTTALTGVIMTIGQCSAAFNMESAGLLASIGTRDAVAMDGSDSVMLGSKSELFPIFPAGVLGAAATGSPPFYKQYIQKYGFYMQ